MGKNNYSNLDKDPYMTERWYEKVNFSDFEYRTAASQSEQPTAYNSTLSTTSSLTRVGNWAEPQSTSEGRFVNGSSYNKEKKTCSDQN